MARKVQGFKAEVDLSGVGDALGYMSGYTIETNRHIGDLAGIAARETKKRMGPILDGLAAGDFKISHMYEFGQVGNPRGRLFDIKVLGGNTGRVRTVTWTPRIAKVYGPSLADRMANGEVNINVNDRAFRPGLKSGNNVSLTKRYIFYQKASMIEFGKVANIKPRNKKLFIPTDRDPRGYIFADKARVDFKRSENFNQFSMAWTHAQGFVTPAAVKAVDDAMNNITKISSARIGKTTRGKRMSIAFTQAQEQTKRDMRKLINAEMRSRYSVDDAE